MDVNKAAFKMLLKKLVLQMFYEKENVFNALALKDTQSTLWISNTKCNHYLYMFTKV